MSAVSSCINAWIMKKRTSMWKRGWVLNMYQLLDGYPMDSTWTLQCGVRKTENCRFSRNHLLQVGCWLANAVWFCLFLAVQVQAGVTMSGKMWSISAEMNQMMNLMTYVQCTAVVLSKAGVRFDQSGGYIQLMDRK